VVPVLLAPAWAVTALTACGGGDGSGGSGASSGSIAVRAGDKTCAADRTAIGAGKATFKVKNVGGDVTEVYVYAKDDAGRFQKIVGEAENIAPQTSRDFAVTLSAGEYELTCKPGQTGNGIRTKLTVTGSAS
jgi:iron uptake system component EfeO